MDLFCQAGSLTVITFPFVTIPLLHNPNAFENRQFLITMTVLVLAFNGTLVLIISGLFACGYLT